MRISALKHPLLSLLALSSGFVLPAAGWSKTHYHWVQLVAGKPQGGALLPGVSVRAIVDHADGCPALYATAEMKKGSELFPLQERPKQGEVAKGKRFAEIKVCEHLLQPDDKLLQTFTTGYLPDGKRAIPVLLPDLSKGGLPLAQMITSGCSGCRDGKDQHCSDKAVQKGKSDAPPWLYEELNKRAAKEAGDGIPPLWIHLGDMRYSGQKGSDGVADAWSKPGKLLGWKEELFEPTAKLMEKGFVVMLRGNHEGCFVKESEWDKSGWQDRGEGWFYFFGVGDQQCSTVAKQGDVVAPFGFDAVVYGGTPAKPVVTQKQVRMVMMDTVRTGDGRDKNPQESAKIYQKQFDLVAKNLTSAEKPLWIFEHIPAYELTKKEKLDDDSALFKGLQQSSLQAAPGKPSVITSAHLHQLSLVRAGSGPLQMTVGNGGVALTPVNNCAVAGKADLLGVHASYFGYLHTRFMVNGGQVQAKYEMPLFKSEAGPLQEALKITCTGEANQPFQPVCTAKLPACAK
ncbi:MAG: metallophosphoesterase [Magnetococcus sp. YQC-3]